MTCKRGDVVLVWFPNSDLQTYKRRPALVVQADHLGTGMAQVVLAMVTSNVQRAGHPSRVLIPLDSPEGSASGVRSDSVVMTDNLTTVLHRSIDRILGRLPDAAPVDAALRHTLGL